MEITILRHFKKNPDIRKNTSIKLQTAQDHDLHLMTITNGKRKNDLQGPQVYHRRFIRKANMSVEGIIATTTTRRRYATDHVQGIVTMVDEVEWQA